MHAVRHYTTSIQKSDMEPTDGRSYRPITNLLVAWKLTGPANYSTVLKVLFAIDVGDLSALVLLVLSAAFDHCILIRRLETSFRLTGTALHWFWT